jgi:hypothetical protein
MTRASSPSPLPLILALLTAATALGQAPPPVPAVQAAVARVDSARLLATVHHLADYPSRHSESAGCDRAGAWLAEKFRALGYAEVSFQEFALGGRTCRNVICEKPGTATPARVLVIGAHYDSRARDINAPDAPAPGADDNASGTAALLELARLLKDAQTPFAVRFVAFSGEEQGLIGSRAYALKLAADKAEVLAMLNMDMIAHPVEPGTLVVESDDGNQRPENDAPSRAISARMCAAASAYTGLQTRAGPIYGSDYMPFEAQGFACAGAFDGADTAPFYHTEEDRPDLIDAAYLADVVRMMLATVLDLAARP